MDVTTLLLVCLISTVIISILVSSITARRVSKKKSYKKIIKILKDTNEISSYKKIVDITKTIIENNDKEHKSMDQQIKNIVISQTNNISKVASVRYDSTPDSGGKMSFSLVMLNEKNTGIVLTNIYMREGSFLYLREIEKGKCDIELSEEEKKLVNQTINN